MSQKVLNVKIVCQRTSFKYRPLVRQCPTALGHLYLGCGIVYYTRRVRVKRGNVPLIDVCSFKAFSCTGLSKKIPAKFGDTCSVRADGPCICCLGQWAEIGRENSNMQEYFCTTL